MRTTTPGPRSLVSVTFLQRGDAFLVPALAAPTGGPAWWTVDRLVALVDGRVRVILTECDYRGRPYRVILHPNDHVVWAAALAPRALAPARLGHEVMCSRCSRSWGYLPVTVCNAVCFMCDNNRLVGI